MPVGAPTVMVAGETPNDLNSDKLGEFSRRLGQEVNGRPIYHQVGNDNRMIWYAAGYWYLGKKSDPVVSSGIFLLNQSLWRRTGTSRTRTSTITLEGRAPPVTATTAMNCTVRASTRTAAATPQRAASLAR